MSDNAGEREARRVVVKAKTPFNEDGIRDILPATMPVEKALEALREKGATSEETRMIADQIGREMGTPDYSILAVSRDGIMKPVQPGMPIEALAEEVEVRTPQGLQKVRVASLQVQAYGDVGC